MVVYLQVAYSLLFVLAAVGCLWGAYKIRGVVADHLQRPLVVFLILTAVWSFCNAVLVNLSDVVVMEIVYIFGLTFGLLSVVTWLWFCSVYTGHTYHTDARIQVLVGGSALSIIAAKLTNPYHHQYIKPAVATEPFLHFAPEIGLTYWLVATLTYLGAGIGMWMVFEMYFKSQVNTAKIIVLTGLMGVPIIPNLFSLVMPQVLPVFYEPLGAAVFAAGIVTIARDDFIAVQQPAQQEVTDKLNESVIIVDERGLVMDFNQCATTVFPNLEGQVGEEIEELAPELANADDGDVLKNREQHKEQWYSIDVSEVALSPESTGTVFVLSNITEETVQRERLKQQNEHMENLNKAMAHELRNPLTILMGQIQMMDDRESPEKVDLDARLSSMEKAVDRIDTVVEDLASIMKYGKPITDKEAYAVQELVDSAWKQSDTDSMELECDVNAYVVAEKKRAVMLLKHLFRFHNERGAQEVTVVVDEAEDVVVTSDGETLDVLDLENVFEYGMESGDGTRVLLANAWTLANLHGWEVEIDDGEALQMKVTKMM